MASRRLLPWVFLNAGLAAYLALVAWWPEPLPLSAAINLLVLAVPGLAWLRLAGRFVVDRASAVVMTLALSVAAGVLVVVIRIVLGLVEVWLAPHVLLLAVLTEAGLLVTWNRPWPTVSRPAGALPSLVLVPLGVAAYAALFLGATRFVGRVPDQDIEVQGTAYSIIHHGTPMMLHDRRLAYHFAHPHLLHWLSAEALDLAGQMSDLKPYYAAAGAAEAFRSAPVRAGQTAPLHVPSRNDPSGRAVMPVTVQAVEGGSVVLDRPIFIRRADGREGVTSRPTEAEFADRVLLSLYNRTIDATYALNPLLWQTRTINLGLTLLVLFFLHEMAALLSGSRLALAAPLAYLAVPEVIGRSCCASYMPISLLFLIAAAWWYLECGMRSGEGGINNNGAAIPDTPLRIPHSSWPWTAAFVAALLLGLSDHKAVVPVAGMVLAGALASSRSALDVRRWTLGVRIRFFLCRLFSSPVVWGFVAGTAVFWAYGLAVAPQAFVQDHLMNHVVRRVTHEDQFFYGATGVYPSAPRLWQQFAFSQGYALPLVGVAALVWLLVLRGKNAAVLAMSLWVAFVAVAFSLVDWRQTKHLMYLMPVLVLAPAAASAVSGRWMRLVWPALVGVSILLAAAASLEWISRGFSAFTPAGGW